MDAPLPSPNIPNPNQSVSPVVEPQPNQLPINQPERPATPSAPASPEVANGMGAAMSPPPAVIKQPPAVDPMALAMSQPMPATPAPAQPAPGVVPLPNLAADVDVIEPEWVDKAEDVVRQHLGDPYGEEEAVEALQEDYLQKRYGFTVHEPDADTTKTDSV